MRSRKSAQGKTFVDLRDLWKFKSFKGFEGFERFKGSLPRIRSSTAPKPASKTAARARRAVATRSEHLAASGLSSADVREVLDALAIVIERVRLSFRWRPQLPDADDDMVLETAVNGRAEVLVTFNRRHFEGVASAFGLTILSPGEAVERVRRGS